ncbi:hypothetical protein FACS189438_3160 [Bacteroidia bacterium]|nr:hypothetical protein FACS189438_3160 [Bacteroidia bacterium]
MHCAIAWMALLYLFIFLWSLFGFTFVTYSFLALVLAAVTAGLFRQVLSVRKFYAGSNLGGRMGLGMSGGAVSFLKMELLYVIRSKRLRMLISLPLLPLLVLGYIQGNSEAFPYIGRIRE